MSDKDDLKEFLENLKLERYYDLLFDEGYECNEDIITMELEDIKDLEIKVPHRKRILAEVQKLKKILGVEEKGEVEFSKSAVPLKKEPSTPVKNEEEQSNKQEEELPKKSPPVMKASVEMNEKYVNQSPTKEQVKITTPKDVPKELLSEHFNNTAYTTQPKSTTNPSIPKIVIKATGTDNKNIDIMDLLSSYKPSELPAPPNTSNYLSNKTPTPTPQDPTSYTTNPSQVTRNTPSTVFNTSSPSYTPSTMLPTLTPTKREKKIDYQELKRLNGLLLNCCQMGNLESAIQYVEQGADDLDKSLACASSGGHKKLAMYLIEKGAKDFNKAFLSACKSGNLEMMLEMYKRGANNLQEGLKEAKLKKHKNLVFQLEKLISQKDQIDPQKIEVENVLTLRQMNSLLLNYSQIGNFEMVKKYVESGANNLDKALCCACSGGQKQIVQYLIDHGAKDFDGAFLTACKSGNREMAAEMIKRGAKNLEQGLEIAKKRENEDMQYDIRLALYQLNAN